MTVIENDRHLVARLCPPEEWEFGPVREMPEWLALELEAAGTGELPDVIPDWVLTEPFADHLEPAASDRLEVADEPIRWAIPGLWDQVPPQAGPSAAVTALQSAVEAVCAIDPLSLTGAQALADTEALLGVGRQLRVHAVRRLADVQDRELHLLAGARSARVWLRQVQPDADASDVGFAVNSRHLRALNDAVDAGLVSIAAAKKVVHAVGRCGRWVDNGNGLIDGQPAEQVIEAVVGHIVTLVAESRMGLRDDDPLLAELIAATTSICTQGGSELELLERAFTLLAQHVPVGMLGGMLEQLFLAIVPSELERRGKDADDLAHLHLTERPDGRGYDLKGRLGIECAERLYTALRSELRRDQANPTDTATAAALREQGLDPHSPDTEFGRPRGRGQRMHDAFDALLGRYLEHGLGGVHHKVPVQINVTIREQGLQGQPGALPAQSDSGQSIPRSVLRRWWCDSRVTAFILSRGGIALRAVHAGRTLTALERKAALIQHGHRCAGIGCCRGSTREGPDIMRDLRPHHVRRYTDDGLTSIDDTVMVCDTLHHDIHEGGKTLRLRNGRYLNETGWVDPTTLERPNAPF